MKRFFILFCLLLSFFSCTQKRTEASPDDISLARIYLNGKLKIGVNGPFAPLFFMEGERYVGFDIDVLDEVCAILDVEPEYIEINWEDKDRLLNTGKIDVLASGFSKTAERMKRYAMTDPILQNLQCVVVRKDEKRYKTADDIKDCIVACQYGGSAESLITSKIKNGDRIALKLFPSVFSAFLSLDKHDIDAVIGDFVVINYVFQKNKAKNFKVLNFAFQNEYYVYAFRKKDIALTNAVNDVLKQMAEDGILEKITRKWFNSDISLIR